MCACTSMAGFCFSGTNEGSFCFCINIIIEFHPNPEFYILLKMWSDLSYRKEENVNLPKFSLGTWHGKNKQYQGYMSAPLLWMPLLSVCCKPQPHSCCMRSSWPQLPSEETWAPARKGRGAASQEYMSRRRAVAADGQSPPRLPPRGAGAKAAAIRVMLELTQRNRPGCTSACLIPSQCHWHIPRVF